MGQEMLGTPRAADEHERNGHREFKLDRNKAIHLSSWVRCEGPWQEEENFPSQIVPGPSLEPEKSKSGRVPRVPR